MMGIAFRSCSCTHYLYIECVFTLHAWVAVLSLEIHDNRVTRILQAHPHVHLFSLANISLHRLSPHLPAAALLHFTLPLTLPGHLHGPCRELLIPAVSAPFPSSEKTDKNPPSSFREGGLLGWSPTLIPKQTFLVIPPASHASPHASLFHALFQPFENIFLLPSLAVSGSAWLPKGSELFFFFSNAFAQPETLCATHKEAFWNRPGITNLSWLCCF